MTVRPDPKPAARVKDPEALARARHPGHDPHHIVRKGSPWFGDDCDDNLLTIPHELHRAYHDGDHEAAREIGLMLERRHVLYVFSKMGELAGRDWLQRRYRLTPAEITLAETRGVA